MLKKIIPTFKACFGYLLIGLNTLFIMLLFFPIAMIKKLAKNRTVSKYALLYLHAVGKFWIVNNYIIVKLLSGIKWEVDGIDKLASLPKDKWYLLISNHQSWNDVLILQFLLNKYLPFQKYLVKDKMRKFPVMGFVWESIDCPFLSREHKGDGDIQLIKQKCKKFKLAPASIATFVEGTRFTKSKHNEQASPYNNLLKPRAGGIAAILEELHKEIKGIVDVSICYQPRKLSFWDLFAGNINKIKARINYIDIPDWLLDKYKNNISYENYKQEFQEWLNTIWVSKDKYLSQYY